MMMDAATGNFALTLENLARLVAGSASFRAEVGAADAAAAMAFVFEAEDDARELPREDAEMYPWAAGTFPKAYAWAMLAEGHEVAGEDTGGAGFMPSIPLELWLVRSTGEGESVRVRRRKFLNWVGAVTKEMTELAKTEGHLYVTAIRLTDLLSSDPEEEESYMEAKFAVQVW